MVHQEREKEKGKWGGGGGERLSVLNTSDDAHRREGKPPHVLEASSCFHILFLRKQRKEENKKYNLTLKYKNSLVAGYLFLVFGPPTMQSLHPFSWFTSDI